MCIVGALANSETQKMKRTGSKSKLLGCKAANRHVWAGCYILFKSTNNGTHFQPWGTLAWRWCWHTQVCGDPQPWEQSIYYSEGCDDTMTKERLWIPCACNSCWWTDWAPRTVIMMGCTDQQVVSQATTIWSLKGLSGSELLERPGGFSHILTCIRQFWRHFESEKGRTVLTSPWPCPIRMPDTLHASNTFRTFQWQIDQTGSNTQWPKLVSKQRCAS